MQIKDYYSILFVTKDASDEEIKKSYRRLALRYHPDKNNGDPATEDRLKEINEAYSVLGDQDRRRQYDTLGHVEYNRPGKDKNPFYSPFSKSPWGFQGPIGCRGRGMGMGKAFGKGRCGMGQFFRSSSESFQDVSSRHSNHPIHTIHITRTEAQSGTVKESLISAGGVKQRVSVRIPPDVKDKAMLFMKGEELAKGCEDVYFQINIVQ